MTATDDALAELLAENITLIRLRREAEQAAEDERERADLLGDQIEDLTRERDEAADEAERLRTGLNEHGEPTGHVVVRTWADVPAAIRDHAMLHHGPGVHQHQRLGIWIIVLNEIDPERIRAKLTEAWRDLGLVCEAAARTKRVQDAAIQDAERLARDHTRLTTVLAEQRAEVERLRIVETASIGAHALLEDAEAEVERLRGELDDVRRIAARASQDLAIALAERDQLRADLERLRGQLDQMAQVARMTDREVKDTFGGGR